uniref:Uncharacterized protein n=1 Tax=Rhizophora mucronata TaxID=61149 RepID=A0A2P2K6W1_RHIMU
MPFPFCAIKLGNIEQDNFNSFGSIEQDNFNSFAE